MTPDDEGWIAPGMYLTRVGNAEYFSQWDGEKWLAHSPDIRFAISARSASAHQDRTVIRRVEYRIGIRPTTDQEPEQ